jgi:hypothetical protein
MGIVTGEMRSFSCISVESSVLALRTCRTLLQLVDDRTERSSAITAKRGAVDRLFQSPEAGV